MGDAIIFDFRLYCKESLDHFDWTDKFNQSGRIRIDELVAAKVLLAVCATYSSLGKSLIGLGIWQLILL